MRPWCVTAARGTLGILIGAIGSRQVDPGARREQITNACAFLDVGQLVKVIDTEVG